MSLVEKYQVYITGNTVGNVDLGNAQESFAEKFKLSSDKANKVFQSPMPFSIKKGLDEKTANAYKKAIVAMGLEAIVEPLKKSIDVKKPKVDAMTLVPREEQAETSVPSTGETKSYATVVEMKETSGVNLEVVYEAPESTLSDDELTIGGWLRFFQVLHIISITFGGVVFLGVSAMVILGEIEQQELIGILWLLAEMLPALVLSVLTVRILSAREEDVPHRVSVYLKIGLGVASVAFIGGGALFYYDFVSEKPTSILGSLIFYYIWTSYFKKSVRVKEYYGVNAT